MKEKYNEIKQNNKVPKNLRSYSMRLPLPLCTFKTNDVKVKTVFSCNLIEKVIK